MYKVPIHPPIFIFFGHISILDNRRWRFFILWYGTILRTHSLGHRFSDSNLVFYTLSHDPTMYYLGHTTKLSLTVTLTQTHTCIQTENTFPHSQTQSHTHTQSHSHTLTLTLTQRHSHTIKDLDSLALKFRGGYIYSGRLGAGYLYFT